MEIWVATTNSGKLSEIKNFFIGSNVQIHSINELSVYTPPKETGSSFEENARIKAKALKAVKPEAWVMAEDSGLEVEGLNNLPGIHSARYAGEGASDSDRIRYLLARLQGIPREKRSARFRCVIAIATPEGRVGFCSGECLGIITFEPKGEEGFGYDPIFYLPALSKTMAELSLEVKNSISHRGEAARKVPSVLAGLGL